MSHTITTTSETVEVTKGGFFYGKPDTARTFALGPSKTTCSCGETFKDGAEGVEHLQAMIQDPS